MANRPIDDIIEDIRENKDKIYQFGKKVLEGVVGVHRLLYAVPTTIRRTVTGKDSVQDKDVSNFLIGSLVGMGTIVAEGIAYYQFGPYSNPGENIGAVLQATNTLSLAYESGRLAYEVGRYVVRKTKSYRKTDESSSDEASEKEDDK